MIAGSNVTYVTHQQALLGGTHLKKIKAELSPIEFLERGKNSMRIILKILRSLTEKRLNKLFLNIYVTVLDFIVNVCDIVRDKSNN